MPEYSGEVTHVELAGVPLWLIPLLPFIGAALNALIGHRLQDPAWVERYLGKSTRKSLDKFAHRWHIGSPLVTAVALLSMLGALTLTIINVVQLASLEPGRRYLMSHAWEMVRIGSLDINFSFAMDTLGAVMALVVTGVGFLIHVYATAYMETEPSYWRFFSYFNLFIFAMLLLVLGDNFIVMFFGWEGVGLCSYLLIGFWYQDYNKASAGMKAFVVNRIGDFGFVCGIVLLFWGLGGAWLDDVGDQSGSYEPDYSRARFVAVSEEAMAHGEGPGAAHGAEGPAAGSAAHGQPAHPAVAAATGSEHAAPAAPHQAKPRAEGPPVAGGGLGTFSMTSYPGAKIYFGVHTVEQLRGQQVESCRSQPEWSNERGDKAQISQLCYAVSPFVNKRVAAGIHRVTIVPGGGATVVDTGTEIATLRMHVAPGEKKWVMPLGPTVSFKELHDQLVLKDSSGKQFFKSEMEGKTVWGISLLALACVCFFIGACGKSAQVPLFVWLPDAMAGPTPVSALIHAATMVTAGVYMVARLSFLFSLSDSACAVVAMVGAITALFAATIGFFQYDIKKVLAYSTVSQLGFMFIGVGVGAYWAGIFHLMTHAFFKACLFLCSGSVIHGMHAVEHDEVAVQDMRNMGGLRKVMPLTARTYFIACLAITAAPIPFFAGFWSKDEILWKSFNTLATGPISGSLIYVIGLVAALGTSFYMWRSYYLTFEGKHAKPEIPKKVKESPFPIVSVLVALAFLSTVGGAVGGFSMHYLGGHGEPLLEQWLHSSLAHVKQGLFEHGALTTEYLLMALSVGGAIAAWALARARYGAGRSEKWADNEQQLPAFKLLNHKYYVDEIYHATFVAAFLKLRIFLAEVDRWIVDGIVNAYGVGAKAVAWTIGTVDNLIVDGAVNLVADSTLKAGGKLRRVQTGRIQNYVYGILGGIAFLAIIQYLLG